MSGEVKTVAVNTLFNTAFGIAVQLLTIATGIFVARHFGVDDFGRLTFAATITGYFALITEFGVSTIAIRVVARSGEPERYILSYLAIRLGLSLAALLVLGGLVAMMHLPSRTLGLIGAYATTIPLQVLRVNWIFYAQQNMLIDNLLQLGEKVVYVICLFSFVFFVDDVIAIPSAIAVSIIAMTALGWLSFLRTKARPIKLRLDRGFIKEMVVQGWPVGVSGAALMSNTNIDTLFVNSYHGTSSTGLYGAAYRLINAMIMAGTYFTNAIFPLSCRRYKESPASLAHFIEHSSRLFLMGTLPAVIVLSVGSKDIILLFFGSDFVEATMAFRILVWAAGLAMLCRLFHNTLVACERQHAFMKTTLASMAFNLACNFLLIPPFGIIGAAVSTVLTELFLLLAMYITLAHLLELRVVRSYGCIASCAGMASSVFLFPLPLAASASLFLMIYCGALGVTGIWGPQEWRFVRTVLNRT